MYKIQLDNSGAFRKDWKKLDSNISFKKKIKKTLQKFSQNPFSSEWNIKKLEPKEEKKFRLRVAEYRVIYSIDTGNRIIIVHRIAMRSEIYK